MNKSEERAIGVAMIAYERKLMNAMTEPDLDPRWEWYRSQSLGRSDRYIKIRCNHLELEPVVSVTGEEVARLCVTCDTQLPPGPVAP